MLNCTVILGHKKQNLFDEFLTKVSRPIVDFDITLDKYELRIQKRRPDQNFTYSSPILASKT